MGNLVKWEGGIGEEQPKTGEPVIKTSKEIGGVYTAIKATKQNNSGHTKELPIMTTHIFFIFIFFI